jgi:ribosomal protein L29
MKKTIDRYIQDINLPKKSFFDEQINTAVAAMVQNDERIYRVRKDIAKQRKRACTLLIEGFVSDLLHPLR